jgi:hypothetical protein
MKKSTSPKAALAKLERQLERLEDAWHNRWDARIHVYRQWCARLEAAIAHARIVEAKWLDDFGPALPGLIAIMDLEQKLRKARGEARVTQSFYRSATPRSQKATKAVRVPRRAV